MNYNKINEVLSDIDPYTLANKYTRIESSQSDNYHEEKNQGDVGVKTEVYKLDFDDMYLRITIHSDSYGDNESVAKIEFVKPVVKEVTVFETVTE